MLKKLDLKEALLKEHSKRQSQKIAGYVGNDPSRFLELVNLFFKGPYRITQRAALPISVCVELYPGLIKPHLKKILNHIKRPNVPVSVKRNLVRLLQFVEIPKQLQALTVHICFQLFNDNKEPIAVRVFSITVLANLAKKLPELKNELIPLIEDQLPYGSAGFISRGRKVLKELKS